MTAVSSEDESSILLLLVYAINFQISSFRRENLIKAKFYDRRESDNDEPLDKQKLSSLIKALIRF